MCDIKEAISVPCGANPAGIVGVYLSHVDKIDAIPAALVGNHSIISDITMNDPAYRFYKIDNTAEVAEYNEALTGEIDGQFINRVLIFTVPNLSAGNMAKFQDLLGGRYVALIQYTSGEVRVIGDKINPLKIKKADHTSGKYGSNDRRGHSFELYSPAPNYAYFYIPDITPIIG